MNKMKQELINDVMTGVLVAATFAAVIPTEAFAQLTSAVSTTQTNVAAPAMQFLGMLSYALGGVMTIAGIAGAKKHADAPANNPLNPAIGKLGAGAAFLAAPYVVGMIANTGSAAVGSQSSTFSNSAMGFQ